MFDMQRFANPEAADRIHPFWFWNGEMDDGHIRRQIGEMADKGLGGFFICARQGLKIPYLSDTWFRKVKAAVEAAKERGLYVWLYDEYPYPSGIAGGEVTLEHPEAKHYTLTHYTRSAAGGERVSAELPWARVLYAKAVPVAGDGRKLWKQAVSIRSAIGSYQKEPIFQKTGLTAYNQKRFFTYRTVQRLEWTAPPGDWEIVIVQEKEIEDFKYYGTFVDPCNREAMAAFIRLTHDKYAEHLGEYFGTTIKGMFTDEIGLLGSIPWSPRVADHFLERNGYDLREHLHALLDPKADDAARIRYDYYQTVHLLLRESYHKQVHDWCERHGLQYVAEVPSVRHTTQLFSHVPGGDAAHEKLGRPLEWILNHQADNFRSNAKMVSSLARQLNRERSLIECFHSVGWSMTLQDARWMIDRLAAQGTNFFNFHAFFYTVDGLTQHDAPPSQFEQNPYWKHFRKLGDYTGRISYAMSSGEAVISAAVLQPTTSLWTRMGNPFHGFAYGGGHDAEKRELELLKAWWVKICNRLTVSGRDFDHLDPELLAQAAVENGTIRLGKAAYSLLVLPPMTNLEHAAWSKIEAFLQQGGNVVAMGQLPYEAIEPGVRNPSSAAQSFGVKESVSGRFWEPAVPERRPQWHKGERNAYYLPFKAETDAELALQPLTELLEKLQPLPVRLTPACGEWGLLLHSRLVAKDTALVFVSNQEAAVREVKLRVEPHLWGADAGSAEAAGHVSCRELSLESGEALPLEGGEEGGGYAIPLTLAPFEARLIEVKRGEAAAGSGPAGLAPKEEPWKWELDASALWEMRTLQPNALRFDTFRMTIRDGCGSERPRPAADAGADAAAAADATAAAAGTVQVKTFIDQCADLASSTGLPVRMRQTFGTPMRIGMAYPLKVEYGTAFIAEHIPEDAALVMDRSAVSGAARIRLNGRLLEWSEFRPAFLYDHMNIERSIAAYLREGVNELAVEVEVEHDWDGLVDAVYVTGTFAVRFDERRRPVLVGAEAQQLPLAAGPYPGYPYYAGEFSFARTVKLQRTPEAPRFELSFRGWDDELHDCAEVLVNGRSLGVRPWTPYRWSGDSALLRKGDNRVEVRVTNTLIGMLEGKYFDYAAHAVKPVHD
jgi:hypothetical protein